MIWYVKYELQTYSTENSTKYPVFYNPGNRLHLHLRPKDFEFCMLSNLKYCNKHLNSIKGFAFFDKRSF